MSRIAIVHPTTLLGKELLDRLALRPQLAADLRLVSTNEDEVGSLVDAAGAATFVGRAEEGTFDDVDLAFFTGEATVDAAAAAFLPETVPAVFASLDAAPSGTLAAVAGFGSEARLGVQRLASAHPATVALALLLGPLASRGLRRAHATVVMPVSTFGAAGIDALFEETRALLTFSEHKRSRLFPTQVAFNLLPLADDEAAVEEQLAQALRIVSNAEIELSVGLAQGGVFHGLTASVAIDLDSKLGKDELRQILAGTSAVERSKEPKKLGPMAAAGEENILLGAVRSTGRGRFRLWAVMDNLVRGGALNSLDLAEELLAAGRPS